MRIAVKDTEQISNAGVTHGKKAEEIKSIGSGLLTRVGQAVKFFFTGDSGKPLDIDLSPEIKEITFLYRDKPDETVRIPEPAGLGGE